MVNLYCNIKVLHKVKDSMLWRKKEAHYDVFPFSILIRLQRTYFKIKDYR